jgi:hypothetical protein
MNATKVLISAAMLSIGVVFSGGAFAADAPKKAPTEKQLAQRAKMKSCNVDAKSQALKGKARKTFMKSCMKKS